MSYAIDLLEIARKDWVMIAVCLVSILVVMVALYNSQAYQAQCNAHWEEQLKKLECRKLESAKPFNASIQYILPGQDYENREDNSQDTEEPGS